MKGSPILCYADVSTAHMSRVDLDLLDTEAGAEAALVIAKYSEGFFIAMQEKEEMLDDLRKAGFSEYTVMLFDTISSDLDVDMLRLDCDGHILQGIPVFDS